MIYNFLCNCIFAAITACHCNLLRYFAAIIFMKHLILNNFVVMSCI